MDSLENLKKRIEFKNLNNVFRTLTVLLFISYAQLTTSQERTSFTTNGREVNIENFNAEVNQMVDDIGISGLSLAIIEDNKVVFNHFYGNEIASNDKKINDQTVFEAASLTKMYLVYVVHQLVDSGKIDLDKPIYQYRIHKDLEHDPRYKLITPRMILSHSSGIENWSWNNNKEVLEIVSDPGEKFVYSGEGFEYLAKVVEQILDEPYEDYVNTRILKPLKLQNTYLKYKKGEENPLASESPSNYANGYDVFGEKVNKWKNYRTIPASGAHTTGEDYGQFLTYFFKEGNLSKERIQDLVKPIVPVGDGKYPLHMGAGFFMIMNDGNQIASFSGNNTGFKAELFYSVTEKRGFVFFTNNDHGKLITKALNKLSVNFNIDFLFEDSFFKQYPSTALSIQKIYREEKSVDKVLAELEKIKSEGNLTENTLNELGELFKNKEPELSMKLLKENIKLFPENPNQYGLLASMYLNNKDYKSAYDYFLKAKELQFELWNVEAELTYCKEKIID
ncbi:serine hydrolase [Aquimarina sp. 2304DJ70-9]|uniref:serine hydrolase n=1 Tax=Aquimarina penaris TaxID=3231044 RepID=UPI003462E767